MNTNDSLTPLQRAIEAAGGQTALAAGLTKVMGRTIRQGHIWGWLNRSGVIPAEYVLSVERVIDGKVNRHELRPDIYPPERVA